MAGQARHLLFLHFKELEKKELQQCRSLLEKYRAREGHTEMSRRRGKKAAYIVLADQMIQDYEDDGALEIAVTVLGEVRREDLSESLVKASQTYLDQRRCEKREQMNQRRQYMENTLEKVQVSKEKNSVSRECFQLEEEYTRLLLINNQYHPMRGEQDTLSSGSNHLEIMSQQGADSYTEVSRLFEPDKHGNSPRIIVLLGVAGIGKTTTALRIMKDWASGQLFQGRFDYVLFVPCREISLASGQHNMADLLFQSYLEVLKPTEGFRVDPKKLLFIVDGVDELKCPLLPVEVDPKKKASMENTQCNFMTKTIFEKAHIIITTRPAAVMTLSAHVKIHRCVQILGFSDNDRKEYFNKYFGSQTLGTQFFHYVQETEILFAACFVPIICWVVCSVIKHQIETATEFTFNLRTLSSLYTSFLALALKQPRADSTEPTQRILKRLCALAREGICEQKSFFEEEELIKHGLTLLEIQSLFPKTYIFQNVTKSKHVHCFIHKSFQEFLAALFFVLEESEDNVKRTVSPQPDLLNFLEKSRNYEHCHLRFTVRFLFGLLSKENLNHLEQGLKLKAALGITSELMQWIKEKIQPGPAGNIPDLMGLLYCLFELQDGECVKSAFGSVQNVDICGITNSMDCKILQFCLENTSGIRKLHISDSKLSPEHLKALSPWLLTCSSLRAWSCSLKPPSCIALSSVLRANLSLVDLDLGFNDLEDSGTKELCKGLKDQGCKLQKLDLRRCGLAGLCCGDLATVLCTNPSLLELTLTDNELGDSGARELCEGLRHPDCRLKKLEMWGCSLTDSCCEHLSLVLGINQNLLELDLGNNKLGDPGARLLCEGLKHPDCKLQKLMLDRCSLTESGCSDLSSVFCVNHRLTDLDLADNELWDSGVAKLCEGLRHPDCKLQRLGLRSCSLTGSSFAELSSMLCTSSSLTALNLGGNSLHDPAVSQLCEGLKHPGCRIQALELWMCSLTESSCVALSSVLSTSPSLTDLDLSDNEIGDSGVKRLCEGLKHTGCKVQKLRLDDTKLTDDCVPELCAALLEKRDLQRLSLRWNLLTDLSIVFFTPLLETCSSLSELKFADFNGGDSLLMMNNS
ncbi:NACHT, LRR and PYD domains-containing protein 12-like isoform X2 [Pleurodeles waltl]|uniref:NACHT, LRR and PYD domains-containing protein 12-like isoform X2 n=1 Tax=Pleurodeles waltl TaxID=8319 RepID=UPI003709C157